jgi:hypothetical protein
MLAKAQAVLSEYDDEGVLTHVSFRLMTAHGPHLLPPARENSGCAEGAETRPEGNRQAQEPRTCRPRRVADLQGLDRGAACHRGGGNGRYGRGVFALAQTESGETVYEQLQGRGFKALTHQPEK